MKEQEKLQILKNLLFDDEKEKANSVAERVNELTKIVYQKEQLSHKVDPIIEDKLEKFVKEMPVTLGPTITQTLQKEIQNSQDAVVEALYPILGKMIKRYIAHEIKMLSEKISKTTKRAFSIKTWLKRTKATVSGVSTGDLSLSEYGKPQLVQMMVVEKNSGLLKAEYSPFGENTMDKEMIAGMLTAIKSFVEDAFIAQDQNLETIEYELYTLHIQNFFSYYVVAAIAGSYTLEFKDLLEDRILEFAKNYISPQDLKDSELFTKKLKTYFTNEKL